MVNGVWTARVDIANSSGGLREAELIVGGERKSHALEWVFASPGGRSPGWSRLYWPLR